MQKEAFEVLWVSRYDYMSGWVLKKHFHEYYQIIAVLDGEGVFTLDGVSSGISAKKLYLISPGRMHSLVNNSDNDIKTLDIKFQIYDKSIQKLLSGAGKNVLFLEAAVIDRLEKIRSEGLGKRQFYKDIINTYLKEIIFLLLRQMHEKSGGEDTQPESGLNSDLSNAFTSKVDSFLEDHFGQNLTLEEMALYMGYNKNYFCKLFRESFQISPMKYLYKFRICKAKELIVYSDYSLKEIAEMTGFESIHHFTRVFGRLELMSPGEWRKKEKLGVRKGINIKDGFDNQVSCH